MKRLPGEDTHRVMAAIVEYGRAARMEMIALRRDHKEWASASRQAAEAFAVVSGLVQLGIDRVVPIASLAPDVQP